MKKKFKSLFLTIGILSPILLTAQNSDTISTSAKIDSIYSLQKKTYLEIKDEPLSNKKYGIEFNLFRLLLEDETLTLSGGFSFYNINRNSEISLPFYYQNPDDSHDLTEFTLDCHYRYFLGRYQKGFYLSGFVRYAYLHGSLEDKNYGLFGYDINNGYNNEMGSENKIGVGFGIGYRIFSQRGLYWGASLSFGRYIIGDSNKFGGGLISYDDDNEYIFDVEFFKFGWAF